MKIYKFHVSGTHCTSCKIYIEEALKQIKFISDVDVSLKNQILEIKTDNEQPPEKLAKILTAKIKPHGYFVSMDEKAFENKNKNTIWIALPAGLSILAVFFLLQKTDPLNIGFNGKITPFSSFLIGLVASVSTCLAVVGGLVLSFSAAISQDKNVDTKIFVLFHIGRLASFALLGGLLGAVGRIIGINFIFSAVLGIFASIAMFFLGMNLIGVFKKNPLTLSPNLFNILKNVKYKMATPVILGFATFFLPCGFTQTMQISALSSESFVSGLLIMFSFALGTFPILAFLSFGSASLAHTKHGALFFKTAGVVIIGLGLFTFISGLASLGVIKPILNM